MAADIVEGLKAIAGELSRAWKLDEDISIWAVRRYAAWKEDPLPLGGRRFSRTSVTRRKLRAWAKRNEHRRVVVRKPAENPNQQGFEHLSDDPRWRDPKRTP